jgi:hypothetical protein
MRLRTRPLAPFPAQIDVFDVQLIFLLPHLARSGPHRLIAMLPGQDLADHAADHRKAVPHVGGHVRSARTVLKTRAPATRPLTNRGTVRPDFVSIAW